MKIKNIVQSILIVAVILGIGFYIRQSNGPVQSSIKKGQHDIWYCPMHPQIQSDHPGRCPICGMDLVKREPVAPVEGLKVKGYTAIEVTPEKQQLIGVKTVLVSKKYLMKTIRTAGEYEGQIYAQVFEDVVAYIKIGQRAIVEVPAFRKTYEGNVSSIDTSVDETTRTIRVRIGLKYNDQKQFKSHMFVNILFPVRIGEAIIVPREAVLDTGLRKIVFICKDRNVFEPRDIQTGMEGDDELEVRSGLKEGERIVVSGNFLLDSESRVQAGLEQGASHE